MSDKKLTFALAGNPNCGKTTLFNSLTGATAYVGNWPGVTVEKRSGVYKNKKGEEADIVDLPGIYSLSPYTPEEVISRNFILEEKPDVVINVLDATNLERNLYMTTQILEMDVPVVVALNMADALKENGQTIDAKKISACFFRDHPGDFFRVSAVRIKYDQFFHNKILACRSFMVGLICLCRLFLRQNEALK